MQSELIKQLIAVIVVIFILTFGFKAFAMVQDRLCETRLSTAEIDIRSDVRTSQFGLLDKKAIPIGCADKAVFVDSRDINKDVLKDYPAIKNSVEGAKANVFLLKGNKIVKAFDVGNITTSYPYFLCVKPRAGKLNLVMEGKGNATRITTDCDDDCTAFVVGLGDVGGISTELYAIGESASTGTLTDNDVEVGRKFCRFNESFTKVEITIKAKDDDLNNVKYIEYLPKECIDDLTAYLETVVIPPYYKIKADPLIMWHFNEIKDGKEETIVYILKIELSDYCKELISGMGIVSGRNDGPYLFVDKLPSTTLFQFENYEFDLNNYFKDPNNDVLTYDAIDYNTYYVSAYTDGNEGKVTAGTNPTLETEVSFMATDQTNLQATGTMKVIILDSTVCYDLDGDGYGECPACGTSKGCSYDGDDCNDDPANNGASVHPGITEFPLLCNGIDDNCNGASDEGCTCSSGDTRTCGTGSCAATQTCFGGSWPTFCPSEGNSCPAESCSADYSEILGSNAADSPSKTCTYYDYPDSCSRNCASGACTIVTGCTCSATPISFSAGLCQKITSCTATSAVIEKYTNSESCGSGKICNADGDCVDATPGCIPQTCASLGYNCGSWSDGCTGTLNCGSCGTGQTCQSGSCVNAVASLDVSVGCGPQCTVGCGASSQSGSNWYYFSTTVTNTGNVDVTLTQKLRSYPTCGSFPADTDIFTISGITISIGGSVYLPGSFQTPCSPDTITETISGKDVYGTAVSKSHSFILSGC